MYSKNKNTRINSDFSKITISLASSEDILEQSYGEVLKPETVNYRTYKPERDGLFCERVFGPVKDYECSCGKYKRIRYKGIICDRCGVEVTEKKVRRERMGHINLVVPVAHIWYFRSLPNKIAYLLGLTSKKLDLIIYYERYLVIQPGVKEKDGLKKLDFLTEEEYLDILQELPENNQHLDDTDPEKFIAKMGAEALQDALQRIDLDQLSYDLRHQANTETSQQRKAEALKRLQVVEAFRSANERIVNKPEWMIVKVIPVIPAELRPLVPLDGGRFATSDLNDLYRRVIIRNNRLKRLLEIKAPEVILRNEKRMLQEAVDSLFDNSKKGSAVKSDGNRPLKSLSDILKGKQGRFRQNLLGKRVDYSARSVIVVEPTLKLHECGLPKDMAAELFKPFIIRKLIERGILKTVKSAKKVVDAKGPIVWDVLENVLKGHPVLLNRAPTLHRLGIQAFQPKLVEGKAIRLHPLVCTAFNADFDGDQMAVHVPLSNAAILEAQILMLASHNILNPANGAPITVPSQDMVLGLYYMTKGRRSDPTSSVKGEGQIFYSPEEALMAYNEKCVDLHAFVKLRIPSKPGSAKPYELVETTLGRILFNRVVPDGHFINEVLTKKNLRDIIIQIVKTSGMARAVHFLDDIKEMGYHMAFKGGLSFNLQDLNIPANKGDLLNHAFKEVDEVVENYNMGFITNNERYNQIIDIWTTTNDKLSGEVMNILSSDNQGFNSVYMMLDSGARGSKEQIRQLCGMRGLMAKPQKSGSGGEIIENPILSNFKEGLSVLEYFVSTHGARKGLADTALKTADAGYLTRRLHDVAQDIVITEEDCGTLRGVVISDLKDNEEVIESMYDRILGRIALNDVYNPLTEKLIVKAGAEIDETIAKRIEDSPITSVEIRSVLTCNAKRGACIKCYGRNLATGRMVQIGEAVGVIAAQSIGEPGTQLTLRTFHVGGTASNIAAESHISAKFGGRLEFENIRSLRTEENDQQIDIVLGRSGEIKIVDPASSKVVAVNNIPYGARLFVKEGDMVAKGDVICSWDPYNAVILSELGGEIEYDAVIESLTYVEELDEQTGHKEKVIIDTKDKTKNPMIKIIDGGEVAKSYNLPVGAHLAVENGDTIKPGAVIAKIPRSSGKTRDITGGLPRVTELFEARIPSNPAIVSEIEGVVTLAGIKRGNREVIVEGKDGLQRKYMIPLSRHLLVQDNDFVKVCDRLSDGMISPADILAIKGPGAVQEYLVNGIQEVYRLQGVKINDKHFEVIVHQMMQKVLIEDPGDTRFLEKETVDKHVFIDENDAMYDKKVVTDPADSNNLRAGQVVSLKQLRDENTRLTRAGLRTVEVRAAVAATSKPLLQGITRASLSTKSFISAASFQETTKVLNEAAVAGKQDIMQGLKENVIAGHLIPAGTGANKAKNVIVGSKDEYEALMGEEN